MCDPGVIRRARRSGTVRPRLRSDQPGGRRAALASYLLCGVATRRVAGIGEASEAGERSGLDRVPLTVPLSPWIPGVRLDAAGRAARSIQQPERGGYEMGFRRSGVRILSPQPIQPNERGFTRVPSRGRAEACSRQAIPSWRRLVRPYLPSPPGRHRCTHRGRQSLNGLRSRSGSYAHPPGWHLAPRDRGHRHQCGFHAPGPSCRTRPETTFRPLQ
jgi:hypothetical protein